jgi:hypothetical protein
VPPEAAEAAAPGAPVLGVIIDNLWRDEIGAWLAPYFDEGHPKRRQHAVFASSWLSK